MSASILIAEDDADIRQGLIVTLESEGHQVVAAADGEQALRLYAQEKDRLRLVILDVMMPRKSGYDVCRELRAGGARVPVLFLTAKGEEIDKVVGLKLGADDYVTKPFGVHELLARVEALLRRGRMSLANVQESSDEARLASRFKLGTVRINRRTFMVERDGAEQALTPREMKLLELFALSPGEVLTRDELLNGAWGIDYYGTTRTLDQHIAQLRKKLETHPEKPALLLTVHGVGYRLAVDPESAEE